MPSCSVTTVFAGELPLHTSRMSSQRIPLGVSVVIYLTDAQAPLLLCNNRQNISSIFPLAVSNTIPQLFILLHLLIAGHTRGDSASHPSPVRATPSVYVASSIPRQPFSPSPLARAANNFF